LAIEIADCANGGAQVSNRSFANLNPQSQSTIDSLNPKSTTSKSAVTNRQSAIGVVQSGPMSRKTVVQARCALCGAKEVSEPRGEERYCRDCWDKKIAVEEIVAREFALKRYIRAHSAEKYLIYHSTVKRPCGQLIVVDDGYDLFLTMVLYPSFAWDEAAYHLEGDPEGRTFAEILVDVVAAEVIEPWGGGKWHLEIFRSSSPEAEDWNGEM
jgi:hypothetical protein